jgi:ketosteroid isomerase-like protein
MLQRYLKPLTAMLMVLVIVLTGCKGRNESPQEKSSFDSTLAIHLNAVATRDLGKLIPTVGDSVTLIMPNGEVMKSKASFIGLHEEWFKETNWQWTPTVIHTEQTDSLAYAWVQYLYSESDTTGNVRSNKNHLLLIFRNSREGWQLVHDQNTRM